MRRKFIIQTRHLPIWVCMVTGLLVAFLVWNHMSSIRSHAITQIADLSAQSKDGAIVLQWTPLADCADRQVEITIAKDGQSQSVIIPASYHSYTYTEGEHGRLYEFSVNVKGEQATQTQSAMFLNYTQLPDLPLVSIETVTGEAPVCDMAYAPEDAWGITAVNNEYVEMQLQIYNQQNIAVQASGEIRVRGNTSAGLPIKPYKIQLDKNIDLLFRNDPIYQDTEWLLIDHDPKLHMEVGTEVSYLCGSQWQPAYMPVNVIMNGDYMGSYLLVESVKVSSGRLNLSDRGFLIENDAYWWDADGLYFRTPYQIHQLAYTFTYPKITNMNDALTKNIEAYVTTAEAALIDRQGDYAKYMDVDSYAGWLLAHDLLGTWDAGGSNMYIYVEDMDASDKLKAGPLWDFDSALMQYDQWANIHTSGGIMHFDVLLQQTEFRETYLKKWDSLSDILCHEVSEFLNGYITQYGEALQESWDLDSERWQSAPIRLQDSADQMNAWFAERKVWLDSAMQGI